MMEGKEREVTNLLSRLKRSSFMVSNDTSESSEMSRVVARKDGPWDCSCWKSEEICREMSGAFSQPRHRHRCFGKMLRSLADPVVIVEECQRSSSKLSFE